MDLLSFLSFVDFEAYVTLIYVLSCVGFFALSMYQTLISLPRLRGAINITINSILCVIIKRDVRNFCSQRFIDLAQTVPFTLYWLSSSIAISALAIFQAEIPIEMQGLVSVCILSSYLLYAMADAASEPQELSINRKWL